MKKLLNRNSIIALASAAVSVCLMAFVFGVLFASKIDEGWKIAGMFVGTYTGGSSNLTAIAVGLDAAKGTIAAALQQTSNWYSESDSYVCGTWLSTRTLSAEKAVAL